VQLLYEISNYFDDLFKRFLFFKFKMAEDID